MLLPNGLSYFVIMQSRRNNQKTNPVAIVLCFVFSVTLTLQFKVMFSNFPETVVLISLLNPLCFKSPYYFTMSNSRWFYLSLGRVLGGKGLPKSICLFLFSTLCASGHPKPSSLVFYPANICQTILFQCQGSYKVLSGKGLQDNKNKNFCCLELCCKEL